jgi:probable HAF family extracellular repeat protein
MTRFWPMSVTLTLLVALALGAAPPVPGANLPAAPGYVITDLDSLGGGQTVPIALNARGDVAGYSTTKAGQIHAFLLPANGLMMDLGSMGGTASYAMGLNNRGDVVGYSIAADGQTRAFALFDGQSIDLGLGSAVASRAVDINDLRQVLVVQGSGQANASSLLWHNGQTLPLGTLAGSPAVGAALNDLSQVVGTATAANGTTHAFAFDFTLPADSPRRLIDLGDTGPGGTMSHLNEIGQAVGIRITPLGARIAFGADLSKDSDFLADKIVRRGYSGTAVYWINNENTATGAGLLPGAPDTNAGFWTADGQFLKLNEAALLPNSGWVLLSANAINDAGVIVGLALAPDGQAIAYRLISPGPALAAGKALAIAQSLNPAIEAVTKGSEAAAKAATPSALATALADLQQARLLLTPAAGEATLSGVGTGQASHLLTSAGSLLTIPDNSAFVAPADRDAVLADIAAARKGLQ